MKQAIEQIRDITTHEHPAIITLSGPSAAGKSTFVATLQETFTDNAVIATDDYYRGISRMQHDMPPGQEHNFDHPAAIQLDRLAYDLRQLKNGHSVAAPLYDMLTSEPLPQTKEVTPQQLIIVEGIVANHPTIRQLAHLSICLTAPASVRLQRRIVRDQVRKGYTPEHITDIFMNSVEPSYQQYHAVNDSAADMIITL